VQGVRAYSEQALRELQVRVRTIFDDRTGMRSTMLVASHTISAATLSPSTDPEDRAPGNN
jgi:hypothetical protein